ncbi:nuclease-related domain-containing protein [Silanimonas sp.]|jgi:hypothetical protein|uniref:nuclease-related domain-containing protein n=1 Tax=Silanimonas sp. TaxID=1929290 RepID=UPI0037C8F46D
MSLFLIFPLLFLPIGLIFAGLLLLRWRDRQDARRLPVDSKQLPNQAGAQIRQRLEAVSDDYWSVSALAFFIGPMMPLAILVLEARKKAPEVFDIGAGSIAAYLVMLLGGVAVLLWQTRRHVLVMRRCREGLAAELATADGLQQLVPDGLMLFHDLPADGFNIDHVVVGHSVVFAVETKSRKKPAKGGKDSAKVRYDGKALKFPEHIETKPLEQAARQARWLAEFLTGATGNPVRVVPVLALPGWYVELTASLPTSSNDVRVVNPKAASFMRTVNFGPRFEDDQRRRIAWALTKRYDDVAED